MSAVTDLVILSPLDDGEAAAALQRVADAMMAEGGTAGFVSFVDVSDHAGGGKAMQAQVFAAAVNYLDLREFWAAMNAQKWPDPECVQVLIKQEHEDAFSLHRLGEELERED